MKRSVAIVVIGAAGLVAGRARAHEVGLSRGDYVVQSSKVETQVVFARRELIGLVAGLDADRDGALTDAEISAARDSIEGALVGRIRVQGDGVPCPGTLARAELTEQDGVVVHAVYRCARRPRQLGVDLAFLADLSVGHRHLARASAGASAIDRVLSQRNSSLSLDVPQGAGPPDPSAERSGQPPLQRGLFQVLIRPWGPAFLLALLVTCQGRRSALLASAIFVAAAAIGLGLGAGGLFMPSPHALGPAVALSLVYAGLEAMASWPTMGGGARWAVALPFGVVHGLAGAAAFQAEGAADELVAFGAGAGLALAAVIAALVPATRWALRRPAFAGRGAAALGAAIAAAGAIGLVTGQP